MEAWRGAWLGRREEEQENREGDDNEGENTWRRFVKFTKGAAREAKLWARNGKGCNNKAIWGDGSYKKLRRNFKLLHQFRVKRTWETKRKYQRSCRGLERCRNRLIKE